MLATIDPGFAQQRFHIGVHAGAIAAQLDGDQFTGYDKHGLRLGLRAEAEIGEKTDLIIELNYEQKGSRFESPSQRPISEKNRIIRLQYAEVPILFRIYHKHRHNLFVETGVALAYLINDHYIRIGRAADLDAFESISDDFRRSELNYIIGVGHQFNSHLGFYFRSSIALQLLYKNENPMAERHPFAPRPPGDTSMQEVIHLRNYLISVGFYYML